MHPTAERGAWLHLWLGEWELAQNEQPAQATWHFRQAQHLTNPRNRCFGLAAYDQALALFSEGAYGEAVDAFAALLQPKTSLPGYSGRNCALWLRYAEACADYHAEHAKLGIPEPPRLDPLCGAASLAACLRALALPCDRATLLGACRVTGEGSSLEDVLNAGRKLGLNARPITADDRGLMALPKPLVAYVEQDHFVALVRADKAGVSYLCSDCGAWPGGRVDLTWKQWHALNPGVYAVVTTPGSRTDALLRGALAPRTAAASARPATKVSYVGPLSALRLRVHLSSFSPLSALRGHIKQYQYFAKAATCGHKPEALHCLSYVHCPTVKPLCPSCNGAAAGDPVNLATGEEEYTPEPDLVVYNPIGPSVSWSRIYNSLRDQVVYPEHNPVDYGVGWSYSYNIRIFAPNGTARRADNQPQPVYLILPNGGAIGVGDAKALGTISLRGLPFAVQHPGGNNMDYVLIMKDHSRWYLTGIDGAGPSYGYLASIADRNGRLIHFNYAGSNDLSSITDQNGKALLYIQGGNSISDCYNRSVLYGLANFGDYSYPELTSVSQVVPTDNHSYPSPTRYTYNYANILSGDASEVVPFLHTITVPSPTSTGTSTATIWYLNQHNDGVTNNPNYSAAPTSGPFVSAIVDSNGNTTSILPIPNAAQNQPVSQTQVQVSDGRGNVLRKSSYTFDPFMRITSLTDYNQKTVRTMTYNDQSDPNEPDTVTDGNNHQWAFTWDTSGNLTSETPPRSSTRAPATTTYTYDRTYFPTGELTMIQTGQKQATTLTYNHTPSGPYLYSGAYIKSITTPQPGYSGNNAGSVSSSFVFDGYGNLTSLTTPGNNATQAITTTFGYTSDGSYSQAEAIGQPLTVMDNLSHTTHFRYDALGRTLSSTDALGYSTSQSYNSVGQPLRVTRPATGQMGSGQSYTAYTYQYVGGPLASLTAYDESSSAIRQVSYQYGPEGETLAVGGSTEPAQYAYDGLYRMTALADGNGHATHYYFNPNGYLDSVTYPGYTGQAYPSVSGSDSVHYPQYDGDGNPLRRIDGNGVETDYTYNDPENLLTNVHYPGGQLADVSYLYDIYGRVSSMTDGTGVTNYEGSGLAGYDDLDNPLSVQTAYSGIPAKVIGYSYFNDGSRNTMTVPGRTYSYSYDAAGRFTNLTNGIGESAAWAYQDNNWPSVQTDSNGLKAFPNYNALGQLTYLQNIANGSLISEFGDVSHGNLIRHDGVGNTLSVTSEAQGYDTSNGIYATTNYTYDSRDQITSESNNRSGGFGVASAYDPAGNPTALRGVPGLYNADNQNTLPAGNNPAPLYDGNGNPSAARGRALAFDPENRLTGANDLAAGVSTAIASGPDNLLRLLSNNNDGSISLTNLRLSDGGVNQVFYPYGPFLDWTALATAVGPNNVPHVLWNRADGMASVSTIDAAGHYSYFNYGPFPDWTAVALAVGRDNAIYLLWRHAPDNSFVYYRIDPASGSVTQSPTPTKAYPLPAGWSATALTVDINNSVHILFNNVNGQLAHWNAAGPYSPPGYVYTPGGGFTAQGLSASVTAADGRVRLLMVRGDGTALLDAINGDNSVSASPVLVPPVGYAPVSVAMDGYNAGRVLFSGSRGDNTILNVLPDNASTSLMTSMTAGHIAGTGNTAGYTGDGLRAWKQTDAGAKTYYLYDGSTPVCELDGSGNVTAQNMFGAWGLVSRSTPATGTAFYAFDERGNVAQRTNGSGGLLSTDVYDAWGKKRAGPADVWGFGGQAGYYTDAETGLILCTHRYYDPQQGRFLTRDPSGYEGGINLYGYTGNNPINGMDPSGLHIDDNYWGGFGKPEAGVPTIGPVGASVSRNVAEAEMAGGLLNSIWSASMKSNPPHNAVGSIERIAEQRQLIYGWYVDQVATGRRWDYKKGHPSDIPPGKHRGTYLFNHYGNFNAGAVAAALGLSKMEAVEGAGIAHIVDHPSHPWTDKEDDGDEWIKKGFDWYTKTHGCKK